MTQRTRQLAVAQKLMQDKLGIEDNIQNHESVGMKTPLIDADGYPRADIDIYAIRTARAALAHLYNDLEAKLTDIEKALIMLHAMPLDPLMESQKTVAQKPFAKVNGVAPGSPADEAGLLRGDLILSFGNSIDGLTSNPLQAIAACLPENEFVK